MSSQHHCFVQELSGYSLPGLVVTLRSTGTTFVLAELHVNCRLMGCEWNVVFQLPPLSFPSLGCQHFSAFGWSFLLLCPSCLLPFVKSSQFLSFSKATGRGLSAELWLLERGDKPVLDLLQSVGPCLLSLASIKTKMTRTKRTALSTDMH